MKSQSRGKMNQRSVQPDYEPNEPRIISSSKNPTDGKVFTKMRKGKAIVSSSHMEEAKATSEDIGKGSRSIDGDSKPNGKAQGKQKRESIDEDNKPRKRSREYNI
jgi:hypothetical protein